MPLHATVSLTAPNASSLGEQRIALLEAIGREGSISAAARSLGMSYRGAWDAICAMNALVGRPLVSGQTGGRRGGGAQVTGDGLRLIAGFRRLQEQTARAFNALAPDIAAGHGGAADLMVIGFRRTSARNALRGEVAAFSEGPVNAEVALTVAGGQTLAVTLTSRSLHALGLFPGRAATALVKAPMVRLEPPAIPGAQRANRIAGVVAAVERDAAGVEVLLDIGGDETLCAVLAPGAAFAPGDRVTAVIDPAHVILAVE